MQECDLKEIEKSRQIFDKGDNARQVDLDRFVAKWGNYKDVLRPNEKAEEFTLVNKEGGFLDLTASRWLCHLLNLRHKSVHILLKWKNPGLEDVFVLQIRDWNKSDSPGHLDISVGGHVVGGDVSNSIESAYRELEEELGISKAELRDGKLSFASGYESTDEREEDHFYNTEWRDVYLGEINTDGLEKIKFSDKEVVGIYLCPEYDSRNLLNQKIIPIASALKLSLPKLLTK